MDSAIAIAAFAMVTALTTAVGTPVVLSYLRNKEKDADAARDKALRVEDLARQDLVAHKAAESQDAILKQSIKNGELVQLSTISASQDGKEIKAAVGQVHTLVNATLTAALADSLDALRVTRSVLLELLDLKKLVAPTLPPSPITLALIESTEAKIASLEAQLKNRQTQTENAAAQLAQDLKKPAPNAAP